jgi:hypothetical protein
MPAPVVVPEVRYPCSRLGARDEPYVGIDVPERFP